MWAGFAAAIVMFFAGAGIWLLLGHKYKQSKAYTDLKEHYSQKGGDKYTKWEYDWVQGGFWIMYFFLDLSLAALFISQVVPTNGENTFIFRTDTQPRGVLSVVLLDYRGCGCRFLLCLDSFFLGSLQRLDFQFLGFECHPGHGPRSGCKSRFPDDSYRLLCICRCGNYWNPCGRRNPHVSCGQRKTQHKSHEGRLPHKQGRIQSSCHHNYCVQHDCYHLLLHRLHSITCRSRRVFYPEPSNRTTDCLHCLLYGSSSRPVYRLGLQTRSCRRKTRPNSSKGRNALMGTREGYFPPSLLMFFTKENKKKNRKKRVFSFSLHGGAPLFFSFAGKMRNC
jgi:hypothetical protein